MRKSTLQTLDRRSSRFVGRRRESRGRRRSLLIGAVLATLLVALVGWRLWAIGGAAAESRSGRAKAAATASKVAAPKKAATKSKKAKAAANVDESRPATLTVAAVGDLLFDRNVSDLIEAEGGEAPFTGVADDLAKADVTVGNLESIISDRGEPADKDTTFRGDPRAIQGLTSAGFDFVSLANDHVMDYGPDALRDSLQTLKMAGIAPAGAGMDRDAAWRPATYERDGAKVAYLAFSHIVPDEFIAQPDRAGMASGKQDRERTMAAIKAARKDHDYVIVSFHWGVENEDYADDEQTEWARAAVDAGADMVLAHHPHVIQGVEFYKRRLIAYSLGDFVFDHYTQKTGESFILHAKLGPDGVTNARAVPVYLDDMGRPEYVEGDEAKSILARLREISKPFDTTVKIKGDEARVRP
ncbi:MAG: CapA family protein [Coriobacteriales bacterium]|nr:CapA family protein [Coriobacteriales bacterium]